MTFLNRPVQGIKAALIPQTKISTMLDECLYSSHMTFFGSQVKGCGLQFVGGVDLGFC